MSLYSASSASAAWLPFLSFLLPLLLLPLFLLKNNKKSPPSTRSNLPPSPSFKLPFLGHLHLIGPLPHRSLWRLSQRHGPIMLLQLGAVPTVVVSSAQMAREVLKTHDMEFSTRPPLIAFKKLAYNFLDVALAPYGDYWREMRKVCIVELFSVKRVQSFAFVRAEEVESLVQLISSSIASSSSSAAAVGVNLSEMMNTLTYKMLCRVAFGRSYEAGSEHEKARFHAALMEAGAMLGGFFVGDFLPWLGWVDWVSGLRWRLERSFKALDAFYDRLIEDHVNPRRGDQMKKDKEDFVDVMLRVQKDMHLSRDHVKGVLMNVLVAGTETASATVVWAMTELIKDPRVMKKATDEVRRIAKGKGRVEESDLDQLDYLRAVIKETWRLHPPGPLFIPHETSKGSPIHTYEVGPKTRVYVNAYAIGRDPQSWENPEQFRPERFMERSVDYKGQHFELIPFGSGRRGCPGMYFGAVTVEIVLANLLYSFDWKLPQGMKKEDVDMDEAFGIVVHKKSALHLVPSCYDGQ